MARRPIKHKLEAAVQRFLYANKAGTGFAAVPLFNSFGYAIGDTTSARKEQPEYPFVTIMVSTTADPDLPGVVTFTLDITYHADSTLSQDNRIEIIETLEEIHRLMTQPVDDDATWADDNREAGAFLAFANKPATGSDTRNASAKPLHIYDLTPQSDPNQLTQAEHTWNDVLSYTGIAQTMDSHDDE